MQNDDRYLTDRELAARYSISRATVWQWVKQAYLPPPVRLTPGTTRWRLSEIERNEAEREAS